MNRKPIRKARTLLQIRRERTDFWGLIGSGILGTGYGLMIVATVAVSIAYNVVA